MTPTAPNGTLPTSLSLDLTFFLLVLDLTPATLPIEIEKRSESIFNELSTSPPPKDIL